MKTFLSILKRIAATLALPLAMYLAMTALCHANGKLYFGTLQMWRTLIVDIAISVSCALGIGLQFKCGRFDFSGGSIMLLSAIIAGNIAKAQGNSIVLMFVLCVVCSVALSLVVSLFYVLGRVPIIISTIGFALMYEALTCLIFGGTGINLVPNMTLRIFSTYPYVLIPLFGAIGVYAFFSYCTVSGRRAVLLSRNQQAAVYIGVNEKRNVVASYLVSGLIFGFATVTYIAGGLHKAAYTSMATVGELFTNIMPVFIGLMVSRFCGDTIGTIVGSVTLCLMSYALKAVYSSDMGSAISIICMGAFVLLINVASAQGERLSALAQKNKARRAAQ